MMESMRKESNRLATFSSSWPGNSPVQSRDLARAGFFYIGPADRVQCAFCTGILWEWEQGDIPMAEHRRYFPLCLYINGLDVGNIVDGGLGHGVQRVVEGDPRYPEYADGTARLLSYLTWSTSNQAPKDLAGAGFFYLGHGDNVRCFFCGLTLSNWESDDVAWGEHAWWSPNCYYVKTACPTASGQRAEASVCNSDLRRNDPCDTFAHSSMCTDEALFPQFGNQDQRLESFEAMLSSVVNSKEMAAAGFFYEALEYRIKCFYCGMFLSPSKWNEKNPFLVHNEDSPNCKYISNLENICRDLGLELVPNLSEEQLLLLLLKVTQPIAPVSGMMGSGSRGAENNQCKICMHMPLCIVFLPCAHLVCCRRCADLCTECPVCRSSIMALLKASLE